MGVVINKKARFATEGFRVQRHNADGTIARPQRFIGFANTADLSNVLTDGRAPLTIKVDAEPAMGRSVDFSGVANQSRVTVGEAVAALNAADFTDIKFSVDEKTGRLKGAVSNGSPASITLELTSTEAHNINEGAYSLIINGHYFSTEITSPIAVLADAPIALVFTASTVGMQADLPAPGQSANLTTMNPSLPGLSTDWSGEFVNVVQGSCPAFSAKTIQVVSPLAAALDFGQGIKHAGNGLEWLSYFDDETVSIGLPKDINDKEEIDIEGAKGTITRMIIGARILGKSPVFTMKEKDYPLVELIQGGKLDRENGTYNPPQSGETEHPSFCAEIFSAIFNKGTNKYSDMSGYERIFLRTMTGVEGDIPIEAKSWAQYAYNCTATEYTDETGVKFAAWEEQTLTVEQFDALRVKNIGNLSENLSAAESR